MPVSNGTAYANPSRIQVLRLKLGRKLVVSRMLDSSLLEQFMAAFVGYGNLNAPYWYVGMEEGGAATAEALEKRLTRWRERGGGPVDDLHDFHVGSGLGTFFGPRASLQTTWKQLVRVHLSALGLPTDNDRIRAFQTDQLGRSSGDTALLELFPLPAAGLAHWPYSELSDLPVLRSRAKYLTTLEPKRVALLQSLVDQYQPKVVVMYGTGYLDSWQRIHGRFMVLEDTPPIYHGQRGNSRFVLMKHPAAKGVSNSYFEAVGEFLRAR